MSMTLISSTSRKQERMTTMHKLNAYCILTIQKTVKKLMERTVARKLAGDLENRENSDQENPHGKIQLHLHMTCTKDSRGKNKQWLWQSVSRMLTTKSSPSC